jgi:hypothetical protein
VSCGRRHLDCVVLLLEHISLEGSCERIVDGLVAASSVNSKRSVAPRKWAVLSDSHDSVVDLVLISVQQFLGACVPAAILHSATEYDGLNYGLVGSGKSTHGLGVLKLCDVVVLTSLARHSCSIRTIFAFLRSSRWSGYCLAS